MNVFSYFDYVFHQGHPLSLLMLTRLACTNRTGSPTLQLLRMNLLVVWAWTHSMEIKNWHV